MRRIWTRRWPVGAIMIGIASVLVLPGLLFSLMLLVRFMQAQQAEAHVETLATATRVRDTLDHELGTLIVAARMLASTHALHIDDLDAFDRNASAAAEALEQRVLLLGKDGRVLFASSGVTGPARSSGLSVSIQRVIAERKPLISGLFTNTNGEQRIAVLAPVLRDGEVIYIVDLSLDPQYFSHVLQLQSLPIGWIASVRDGDGRMLARNIDASRFLGTSNSNTERTAGAVERRRSLEGDVVFGTVVPLAAADWQVGIGVPVSAYEEPIRYSVLWLSVTGAATLGVGCLLAGLLARSVSHPLRLLAEAGGDLGAARRVTVPIVSRILEVEELSRALVSAGADLEARAAALTEERARLAAIIETVPVGLVIAEAPTGRIRFRNRHLARILPGVTEAGAGTELDCLDAAGAPIDPARQPLLRALAGEDPAELRGQLRRPDGSLFWVQVVAAPFHAADGQVTGAVLALSDVHEIERAREQQARWTERLEEEVVARTADLALANQRLRDEITARGRAEEQLRQAQKMEAVGQLTGGIAHDFNNLLTVITGSLELLRRRVGQDARILRLVDNAQEGANRAANLTQSLLAFARRQPLMPQPVDVNRLVLGMSKLLRRTLGETIRTQTALAEDLWPATADPNQLESALLNLAVNGRDAIREASPDGGTLLLTTANTAIDAAEAAELPDAQPGEYVVVAVTDTGAGMSPDTVARAFEPFFTTKPQGQGTGLGLSQVHGFAAQSGGLVTIESTLGRGTTVRLFLPRLRQTPADEHRPGDDPAALPAGQGERILVVEDDPGVRAFAVEALTDLGYAVLQADGAEQALLALDTHADVALLMTDVVMAGINGRDLAAQARRLRPNLPVLLTSGYSGDGPNASAPDEWDLLGKPFTVSALARCVRKALA